jgi:transcriptional regulator with XRE-family HTH domain
MYIGKRVKKFRELKDMTLSELAQKSGVQIATLSRMEHHKMTGTLECHVKIARALDIDITQLYADLSAELQEEATKHPKEITDVFVHSEKSSYEILTTNVIAKKMIPILIKIEPGGKTTLEKKRPGSERFVLVLSGQVDVIVAKKTFPLLKNHSLYFDAALSHYFTNKGSTATKLLSICTPVTL